jgi:hypothetical protein
MVYVSRQKNTCHGLHAWESINILNGGYSYSAHHIKKKVMALKLPNGKLAENDAENASVRHCPQASGFLCHSEFRTPKFTKLPFVLPFKIQFPDRRRPGCTRMFEVTMKIVPPRR